MNFSFSYRRIEGIKNELILSSYYLNALEKLKTALSIAQQNLKSTETKIICFGIGHFSDCSISRHQLAFILAIKQYFNIESISFHEPILYTAEADILKKLNCSVVAENLEGKVEIESNCLTIVHSPHCPKQLTNNLLWKNWNSQRFERLIFIGNSFSSLLNSTPSRFLSSDANYIVRIQPHCEEVELENNFKFTDIFNDTSLHRFSNINSLPEEFWSENHSEPVYDSNNLELITSDLIEKLKI